MTQYRPRVLIVDGDPRICSKGRACLSALGYQCDSIHDPLGVMDLLSHEKFDIIITEITMPGLNGLELLDYVNKYCPSC
ncbi:MAG TPA: response regulator, partial [Phycisphaerae bacterium]|nr:response regulator [Phycisphaerae bacterium]